jgi:hypothetical protein
MITGVRIAVKYKHKFFPVFAQALTRGKMSIYVDDLQAKQKRICTE